MTFGDFVRFKRKQVGLNLKDISECIDKGRTAFFYIEHDDKRISIKDSDVEKLTKILKLDKKETETLYDLFAEREKQIPIDIYKYVKKNKKVKNALRLASKYATDADWDMFSERLQGGNNV